MGSSTAAALLSSHPGLKVSLASRSPTSFEHAVELRPELRKAKFQQLDVSQAAAVKARQPHIDFHLRYHPCEHTFLSNDRIDPHVHTVNSPF